ncbi:hypothetical protein HMPREF1076_05393 [Parabacteroides goldsteinii CL02T12C30]|uniref:Uncharacterized protein n=1 Tax=Parabacteroides goldsteinii CL02T12C30 TaxID=999418 RepID=K5Z3A4_9BACT|nr:hypothetical protein HMPREF1076_05397 [Parabacteroides goldsteinii CL02T12C30]EKN05776.1 hypothetical protein HMPREF1076_05393 [Parabacteroides goldsteinii CL02T12C30]
MNTVTPMIEKQLNFLIVSYTSIEILLINPLINILIHFHHIYK